MKRFGALGCSKVSLVATPGRGDLGARSVRSGADLVASAALSQGEAQLSCRRSTFAAAFVAGAALPLG